MGFWVRDMGGYVVITRPQPDANDYALELKAEGYQCLVEPMLRIDPMPFEIPNLSDYDGVLVTSANAVDCYRRGGAGVATVTVYCVGKHSAQAARDAGFDDVFSVDGTGADLLMHVLTLDDVKDKRFLHLCGRHIAFPIVGKLNEAGVAADMLVVYEAVQAAVFSDDFVRYLRDGKIEVVTFFSKRTAEAFVDLVRENFNESESEALFSGIKSLSISTAVLECVRVLAWDASHVSDTPDRAGMLALLQAYV